jgi:hypothetical protein
MRFSFILFFGFSTLSVSQAYLLESKINMNFRFLFQKSPSRATVCAEYRSLPPDILHAPLCCATR